MNIWCRLFNEAIKCIIVGGRTGDCCPQYLTPLCFLIRANTHVVLCEFIDGPSCLHHLHHPKYLLYVHWYQIYAVGDICDKKMYDLLMVSIFWVAIVVHYS